MKYLIKRLKKIHLKLLLLIYSDERFIKRMHKKRIGVYPDLKNPSTINEKLLWLKLHDRKKFYTQIADKYRVRDYVREQVGKEHLTKIYLVAEKLKGADIKNLPDSFVIKANHGCGQIMFIKDKTKINWDATIKECNKWLKFNYYKSSKEWQYKNIRPLLIIEEYLQDEKGRIPLDYKFHCFNGMVRFIQVDIDRFLNHKRNFYDRDWNLLPFNWYVGKNGIPNIENGRKIIKPDKLSEMIDIADILSTKFKYVRVDLYINKKDILFGELTLHPDSGYGTIYPKEYNLKIGEMLKI